MKYRVLKPRYVKTYEKTEQGQTIYRVAEWIELGFATSMADAKRLHPTPVLEAV